ncbi:hypothetical protein [Bartonella machadoae]|uniref:hypothetical protein n=1 Tax=Bartonella machadoae TaxID=2893471 RepID=UPI001F4C570F|nr:hypothetical protein [Bartonella machadoae]UNE54022.1 hypothetical protein LNM86_10750 [Bartonella machadoae]
MKTELTAEHMERMNKLMMAPIFKETYRKVVPWMKKNGIIVEKFIDPLTNKKRHKPTMLLLHWWLYMVDGMITALYEKQQEGKASGLYRDLASLDIYFKDIPQYTEYETLKKILGNVFSCMMPDNCESLCLCKKALLSLLYDISSDYKAAREIFIHYKMLIDAVKEGYLSFDKDCYYSTVQSKIYECKVKDKEEKKGLCIDQKTPTFEEAYKLGVKEWMRDASEKCDNRLVFWEMLVRIDNSRDKLRTIFGDEKVKTLEEAIKKEQEKLTSKMNAAIWENEDFHYNESYEYLIGYLQ